MPYIATDAGVQGQQFLVQTLTIPFTITASASSASVLLQSDCPAILLMKTAGVDQITPALAVNETASFSTGPTDSSGTMNVAFVINQPLAKVCKASIVHRDKIGQSGQGAYLSSATGITTGIGGGQKITLVVITGVSAASVNTNAVLEVQYETSF